jgi:hypothetical protein
MEGDKFYGDLNTSTKPETKTHVTTVVFITIKPYFQ